MSLVKFDFSRNGKKHVLNKDLLLEEVDSNIAGVSHKPATIAKNTNLLIDSEDILNSTYWQDNWSSDTSRFTLEKVTDIPPPIDNIAVYKVTRVTENSVYLRPADMFIYPEVNYVFSIYVNSGNSSGRYYIQEWQVGIPEGTATEGSPPPTGVSDVFPFDFRVEIDNGELDIIRNYGTTAYKIEDVGGNWFRIAVSFKITRDLYQEILTSEKYTTAKDENNVELVTGVFPWKDYYFRYRFITYYPNLPNIGDYGYFAGQQLYTVTDEDIENQDIFRPYVSTTSFNESIDSNNEQSVFRGIKLQQASNNILTNSSDFSLNWTVGSNFSVLNDTNVLDPKGGTSTFKLESSTSYKPTLPAIERVITETSATANRLKVFSVFAKAGSTHHIKLGYSQENTNGEKIYNEAYFDLSTGSYVLSRYGDADPEYAGSEYMGNGWYRIYISCIQKPLYTVESKVSVFVYNEPRVPNFTSLNTPSSVYLYGAQVEDDRNIDSFYYPADYIDTQGLELNNSAETLTLTNASNYINQVSQTIFLELELNDIFTDSTIFSLYNSSSAFPAIFVGQSRDSQGTNKKLTFSYYNYINNTFLSAEEEVNIQSEGNTASIAIAYNPDNFCIYLNGSKILNNDSHGFILDENIVLDTIKFGSPYNNINISNYIKSFAIFRRKLDDNNLQAITSGEALKNIKPFYPLVFYGLEQQSRYSFYSFKHVNQSYNGPLVKVRRSLDNETLDLNNYNGWVSTQELETFAQDSNVYIDTWYDQSGLGNHITNTDTTKQPMIYQGGVGPIKINGNLACYFDGVNDSLNATFGTPIGADKEFCAFVLAQPSAISNSTIVGFKNSDPLARVGSHRNIVINSGDIQIQTDVSEFTGSNNAQLDIPFLFSTFMLDGVTEVFTNGIFHGQTFDVNMSAVDEFSLGKNAGEETGFFNGYVQEVLLYDDDIYSSRVKNENHINDYYSPFLSFDKFISSLIPQNEEFYSINRSSSIVSDYTKGLICVCSQGKPNVMYSYVFS